jgi:hypothetical protein
MPKPGTVPRQIRPGLTISGPFIPVPMEVLAVNTFGTSSVILAREADLDLIDVSLLKEKKL